MLAIDRVTEASIDANVTEPERTILVDRRLVRIILILVPSVAPLVPGLAFGTSHAAFLIGLAVASVLLLLSFFLLRTRPVELFAALFLWLTIERMAVATISPALDPYSLRLTLAYKELFFPVLLVMLLPRGVAAWRRAPQLLRVVDVLAVAFGALLIAGFILSDADLSDRVVNGRRLAVLPLAYVVARLLPWKPGSLRGMLILFVAGAVAIAVFGLAERTVLEPIVWSNAIPAAYYYHLSTAAGLSATGTDFPVRGLPVVFFDFTSGEPQRRLVSTFLEATTVASFLAFAATVGLALRPLHWRWIGSAGLIAIATLLTLSKAGWAILGIGVLFTLAVTFVPRLRDPVWLVSLAATVLGALVVVAVALESTGVAAGPLAHFEGLKEGIESAFQSPFGIGLGYGGNFGASKLGAESTFGVTLVQLGWPGLILWAGWLIGLAIVTSQIGRNLGQLELVALATGAALSGFFATAALTESAGGLLGNWPYGFVAGAIVTVGGVRLRHQTLAAEGPR